MKNTGIGRANMAHMTTQRHDVFRTLLRNAGSELGLAFGDFLVRGRYRLSAQAEKEIKEQLPAREAALVGAALDGLREDLARMPSLQSVKHPGKTGAAEVRTVIARAGQILMALRLDGEGEKVLAYLEGVMARLIEESAWAVQIIEESKSFGVDPIQLAPCALACALFDRPLPMWTSLAETIGTSGLNKLTNIDAKKAVVATENLFQRMKAGDELVATELAKISEIQQKTLGRTPVVESGPMRFAGREEEVKEEESQINIKVLSGFLASGRGGSDKARLEGVVALLRDIGVALRANTRIPLMPWDSALVGSTFQALKQLDQVLRQERLVHKKIEHMWRAMDENLKRAPKKEGEKPALPLPRIEPMDARAMYYQHALVAGMPVGIALSEIYDSDELSCGPTERLFFERLALYSARRYAADMASSSHSAFRNLGENSSAESTEHARSLVRSIESGLRQTPHLSDDELRLKAKNELEKLSGRELNMSEVKQLTGSGGKGPSLIEEMVLRIRAEQEVRFITAQLSLAQGLTPEVIASLKQLPHTASFAKVDSEGQWFWNQPARNGQALSELNSDTRSRWLRYRQEASAYKDVRPVVIPGSEEDVGSHNPFSLRTAAKKDKAKEMLDKDDPYARESAGGFKR